MATNLDKLRSLLQELFQMDRADLDFGIYRIMNQKRDEVVRFLDKDLLPQVQDAFKQYKSADKSVLQGELDKAAEQARNLGVDPETTAKVKELRQQLSDSAVDVTALENEVFSHLFNFFRRYYSEGDFISLRRYKEGVYAIPYEGEEVKLHWANADQYYVKSSESFRDYTFKLPGGKRVRVHLVAASTEQDNNKAATGKERRFVLADNPISEENGELFVRFEYRTYEGKEKQDDLNKQAIAALLQTPGIEQWAQELGKFAPTDKNPERTVLEKHLTQYTARNTFDYFIHKDLGGFLNRELDFFIKNEVMHLDDIEHESAPKVEQYLSQIKVIRSIAHKIIQFLEQLENFQKKLWLKKKFVIETNYCITLDRVPEELYSEIAANDAQREEWVRLFAIDEIKKDLNGPGYSKPLKVEFLKSHPSLVIDTCHFEGEFTTRLMSSMEGPLAQTLNGVVVHGDNFQAITLMHDTLASNVNCTYIDPPYNTGSDDNFPYKDNYQHSTWLSLLADRIGMGRSLLSEDGVFLASIGIEEHGTMDVLLKSLFGEPNKLAELAWEKGRKNDARRFSVGHDYIMVYARSAEAVEHLQLPWREPKEGVTEIIAEYQRLKQAHAGNYEEMSKRLAEFYRGLPAGHPSKKYQRAKHIDKRGIWRDNNISWPGGGGPTYDLPHPVTGKPCLVPKDGWRFVEATMKQKIEDDFVVFREDHTQSPFLKSYIYIDGGDLGDGDEENSGQPQVMGSVFYRHSQPSNDWMKALFGDKAFANPKDHEILGRLIRYVAPKNATVLDYFAGSGSTAHAVIESNRSLGGNRRYVVVEIGRYFDTVLLPRIKKVVYSAQWQDGKPQPAPGISHSFKYVRLESYEDALNNLELKRTDQQASLLDADAEMREQYMLSYMLDVESRGSQSLLNVEAFRDPDEYKLRVERNGETQLVNVDLVETFNWLLGLTVKHIDVIRGVRVVEGTAPNGDRVLALWRNIDQMDNDALDKWFEKQDYNTREMVYDVFYVNGDNNLENLRRPDQTWKVRLIEEEFQRLMFDVGDV